MAEREDMVNGGNVRIVLITPQAQPWRYERYGETGKMPEQREGAGPFVYIGRLATLAVPCTQVSILDKDASSSRVANVHFLSPRQSRMNREARTLLFVSSTGLDVHVTFVIS